MGNEGKYATDVTDGQPTIRDLDHPEAVDDKMVADAHAKLTSELDAEDAAHPGQPHTPNCDAPNADSPHYRAGAQAGFDSLVGRLHTWLDEQPDVTDIEYLGGGFFGFNLAGIGGVSLAVGITQ